MKIILSLLILVSTVSSFAQRKLNNLPDIPGYMTLKGDFHVHTDFSDGTVWPTIRIDEAVREGIDIIAITDHVEYRPHKDYMKDQSHNLSYDIALPYAKDRNVVLVKGVEITRPMPTGHLNCLFVTDVNKLTDPDFMKVMEEANRQGAFVFWNHPGWKTQQPDGVPKFHPVHEELLKKGWLHGVEFYNTKCAYGFVLDWCKQRNLTVFANSDVHIATSDYWDITRGEVRPVTLVFAKERNVEGVREALKNGRTLALYNGDSLGGKPEWAEAFFRSSIKIDPPHSEDKDVHWVQLVNESTVTYRLKNMNPEMEPKTIYLKPKAVTLIRVSKSSPATHRFMVGNVLVGDHKYLEVDLKLK
ncbi:MAG TPA: PHP domain-containing protein [Cyclobacteriaceae bacterium]|nr:PHP domain-containing protein [Cyclobacteriaceae bacterium]